jgi:hypothetical protein
MPPTHSLSARIHPRPSPAPPPLPAGWVLAPPSMQPSAGSLSPPPQDRRRQKQRRVATPRPARPPQHAAALPLSSPSRLSRSLLPPRGSRVLARGRGGGGGWGGGRAGREPQGLAPSLAGAAARCRRQRRVESRRRPRDKRAKRPKLPALPALPAFTSIFWCGTPNLVWHVRHTGLTPPPPPGVSTARPSALAPAPPRGSRGGRREGSFARGVSGQGGSSTRLIRTRPPKLSRGAPGRMCRPSAG